MRQVVHEHMEESKTYYDKMSLKITDGISQGIKDHEHEEHGHGHTPVQMEMRTIQKK